MDTKAIIHGSCICLAIVSYNVSAAPIYTLGTPGLYDLEHTRDDGYKASSASRLNNAGHVAGRSQRYNGTGFYYGLSAWLYDGSSTSNIGLTDTEHTQGSGGSKYSIINKLNEAGQVAGYANRYNSAGTSLGQSAWLYDGNNTSNIGLTDTEHTRDDSYKASSVRQLNEAGQVIGSANRYSGAGASLGSSAWLYNGSNTANIGLIDTEHTGSNGFKNSTVRQLNETGQVIGSANRYSGAGASLGSSAWLYNGSNTANIGLIDTEHTGNNGFKSSFANQLNEAGQVTGNTQRYNSTGTSLGSSAWLYNGNNTSNIGLTDTEHTRNDGYKHSSVDQLNAAGQVAGIAQRYSGTGTNLGRSIWLHDGSNTSNIGLTDTEHTRNDGYKNSSVNQLNEAGQVTGTANRYSGTGTFLGQSVWLHDGNNTSNIGLTDTEHTRNDGYKSSTIRQLNEAGEAVGNARRYSGTGTSLGFSAWLYDGNNTSNIGLTDTEHTGNNGYKSSTVSHLNEAGQVAGIAARYDGTGNSSGGSAWLYDSDTDTTYFNDFSIRASDGFARSQAVYLDDAGLMLGFYHLFDETDSSSLGNYAFGFTVEDGFFDLGLQIEDGLDSFGWDSLASAYLSNDSGQILGYGLLDGITSGQAIYLATPSTVPVPAAVWLFGSGLLGLIGVARRKNHGYTNK